MAAPPEAMGSAPRTHMVAPKDPELKFPRDLMPSLASVGTKHIHGARETPVCIR